QPDLWVVNLTPNAKPRNLTEKFDFDIGDGPFGDNAPPRAGGRSIPIWTPDGRSLVEIYGKEGKAILASFDATTGAVSDLVNGNQAISRFRAPNDGSKVVYTVTTPTRVGDLFVLDRQSPNSQPRQLTDVNKLRFTGGSGGGLLTSWVVGHTTRFAAAVAQRDIASWADWWSTADFTLFQPAWFKGPPFDQEEDVKARSPITYIKDVKTPM